jgi:hypothetical protein
MSSLYPNLQNSISNIASGKGNGGKSLFFFARVNDILLSPQTKTKNFFTDGGGWAGLGSVKFTPLGTVVDEDNPSNLIAKPLFNNISKYPILEEIVMILNAPSYGLNDDPQSKTFYYLTTVGLWNSVQHNAFPDIASYGGGELNFGQTFVEKADVRSLLPEEGDILIEGRFGNSIRFSSTTKQKTINNPWSTQGTTGMPITIIRNNQSNIDINSDPWVPVYEDPNNDGSSIYLCAGQDIPLEYASKNLKSFNITLGAGFNSSLQIPDPRFTTPDQSPKEADNLKQPEPLYYVTESITQIAPVTSSLITSSLSTTASVTPITPPPTASLAVTASAPEPTGSTTQPIPIASLRILDTDSTSMVGSNSNYFNILKKNGKYVVIKLETVTEFNPRGVGITEFVYPTKLDHPLQYQGYGPGIDTNQTKQIIVMSGASGTYIMKLNYMDTNSNKIDLISDSFTQ